MVYALALRLHKTAAEVMAMSGQEFGGWMAYFALERQEREQEKAGDLGALFQTE
jgi:hypothetical protein